MKKRLLCLLLAAALALALAACGAEKLSGDDAWAALKDAHEFYLTGDLDDINTFSDILADGKNVGKVQEKGLFNNTMVVTIDGREQFYYRYAKDDEFWNNATTTYVCCDMDDNVLGYMHLLYGDGARYYAFCDAQRNEKGYYIDEDLTTFTNAAGEPIASCEAKLDSIATNAFHVEIKTYATQEKIDYIDKLAVYWSAVSLLNDKYN